MDIIELWNKDTKALISPDGAWLTNLSDEYGDILFPKRQLVTDDGSQKTRGGSHVCLPQFGPGGDSGLAQHGFGRALPWEVKDQTETSVSLVLQGSDDYEGLIATLTYALGENELDMSLGVDNNGATPLRVAPAFHPYFALMSNEQQVRVDGQTFNLVDLHEMQQQAGDDKQLQTKKRLITLSSNLLHEWALWTDQLGSYVCVEPTLSGYAFLNPQPGEQEILQPGETKSFSCRMSWRMREIIK